MARYRDRAAAAEALIGQLPDDIGADWLVLALPRGGVPVGAPIARHLGASFDVLILRKVGAPGNPELALAAVTGPGPDQIAYNDALCVQLGMDHARVHAFAAPQIEEVARREALWRGARPAQPLQGRKVLIVDDGMATGTTMAAAVQAVRAGGATRIAVAVPVALGDALDALRDRDLTVICPWPDAPLGGVGQAYAAFPQVSDEVVRAALEDAASGSGTAP
jgi:putative phosphoribosyl transferase